jgi:hypothetical protein
MPATVDIIRLTGVAPGTPSIITGINTRGNAFDTHTTADASNSVQIPVSGSNYSYWVNTRLTCSVAPAGTINNIRWYTDGGNNLGTGISMIGNAATGYTQATGTPGQTGSQLTVAAYTGGVLTAPVDPFTFTSATPKSMAGSLANPATGQFGSLFVYQFVLSAATVAGTSGQETLTWKYDET